MLELRKKTIVYEINTNALKILLNSYALEVWKELVEKYTLYFDVRQRENNQVRIRIETDDFDDHQEFDTDKFKTDEELTEYLKGIVRDYMKSLYEDCEPENSELFKQGKDKFN